MRKQNSYRLNELDSKMAELKAEKDAIESRDKEQSRVALDEIKRCSFEVCYGGGIYIKPSPEMKKILPSHMGSQDVLEIELEADYYLHMNDCSVTLHDETTGQEHQNKKLRWLAQQGVPKSSVVYCNHSIGSVQYAQYALQRALKEQAEVVAAIDEVFA